MKLDQILAHWIANGGRQIGEILVTRLETGFELRHCDDENKPREALQSVEGAAAAREMARYSSDNKFRPLKYARSMKTGWFLTAADIGSLRLALDELYPACVGLWRSFQNDDLAAVPLQSTLDRQTGMYRIAKTLNDNSRRQVIERTCVSQCLRVRLWDEQRPDTNKRNLPLLCAEACNFLVADCRRKAREKK